MEWIPYIGLSKYILISNVILKILRVILYKNSVLAGHTDFSKKRWIGFHLSTITDIEITLSSSTFTCLKYVFLYQVLAIRVYQVEGVIHFPSNKLCGERKISLESVRPLLAFSYWFEYEPYRKTIKIKMREAWRLEKSEKLTNSLPLRHSYLLNQIS